MKLTTEEEKLYAAQKAFALAAINSTEFRTVLALRQQAKDAAANCNQARVADICNAAEQAAAHECQRG